MGRRRVTHLVLDCEGLSQGAIPSSETRSVIHATRRANRTVYVSAVTLTEVLRGGPRDARVHALLELCRVQPVTGQVGRAAGELLGRARRNDTVDVIVAVTADAIPPPVEILTSDPKDLAVLTEQMPGVSVQAV